MTAIIVTSSIVILCAIVGVALMVRRTRKRRNYNPDDVYPLW